MCWCVACPVVLPQAQCSCSKNGQERSARNGEIPVRRTGYSGIGKIRPKDA